jgi:hypothetical protein
MIQSFQEDNVLGYFLVVYIIYIIDLNMEHIYMRIPVGKWSIN